MILGWKGTGGAFPPGSRLIAFRGGEFLPDPGVRGNDVAGNNQSATVTKLSPSTDFAVSTWTQPCVPDGAVTIRVLLVEDLGLMRGALAALLSGSPDIEVVDQLEGGPQVVSSTVDLRPDVVVVDVDLSSPYGLTTVRNLRDRLPECRVLALAAAVRPGTARGALDAQALGVLDKDATPKRLWEAVRRVAAGCRYIDPDLAVAALCVTSSPLTARELSVLRLAAEGASALEIAAELSLSGGTVRNYLSRVVTKTGARSRIDAIRIAREAAWI